MTRERLRMYMRDRAGLVQECVQSARERVETWVFDAKHATYGLAVLRISYGLLVIGTLAVNCRDRYAIWGPGARWAQPAVERDDGFPGALALFSMHSPAAFTALYVCMAGVAFAFLVGWRTRLVTPALLLLWIALNHQNPLVADGSDNVVRLGLVYLCFADVSKRWSVDAKRRARAVVRSGARSTQVLPSWFGNLFHNAAVAAIAYQVCVIYVAAGMYKTQGALWQDGSAVYYAMHERDWVSWPGLNDLVTSSAVPVFIFTYATVFVQIAFPLLMLARPTRVVGLVSIIGMHLGIGIFMGLPFFALAMIGADMIFVRDGTYERLVREFSAAARTLTGRQQSYPGETRESIA